MISLKCNDVTKIWNMLKRFSNFLQYLCSHVKLCDLEEFEVVDNLFKKAKKARQVDIMTSQSDVNINFLKICRVHISFETVINAGKQAYSTL